MTDTKNLIRQHNDIKELAEKINAYRSEQLVTENAFNITMLIGQLSGKIKVHMTTEDKFVYPTLAKHSDSNVRNISGMFYEEMGDLAKVFESYKTKYLSTKNIVTNPASFIAETKTIVHAISKRIDKENTQLYPLLS
ncbi:hemerythrin domain-containing protein [Dendrosporobacter sp. 1207_IL3150]|uniref:hemerythrin domain-containing protein n=1 Tax=Dendrosporobacter sp. 1207_IL3150 TaxID=3084054 RepID=UPI002FD9150C